MREFRISSTRIGLAVIVAMSLATGVDASIGSRQQDVPTKRNYGDEISLDQLHEAAKSDHPVTRIDAIRRIAAEANPRSMRTLVVALEDSDSTVREIAAVGLARIGNPESVPALVVAMHDENADVRSRAAVAIAGIEPSPEVVRGFLAGLDTGQSKSVGFKGRRAVLQSATAQEAGLRRANRNSRNQASGQGSLVIAKKVLRQMVMSAPANLGLVVGGLSDASPVKRYTAAYALGVSKDSEVMAALEDALRRQDVAVISGAYEFFIDGRLADAKAALLSGLEQFDDPDLILAMSRCGDGDLESAAERVAQEKGIRLH